MNCVILQHSLATIHNLCENRTRLWIPSNPEFEHKEKEKRPRGLLGNDASLCNNLLYVCYLEIWQIYNLSSFYLRSSPGQDPLPSKAVSPMLVAAQPQISRAIRHSHLLFKDRSQELWRNASPKAWQVLVMDVAVTVMTCAVLYRAQTPHSPDTQVLFHLRALWCICHEWGTWKGPLAPRVKVVLHEKDRSVQRMQWPRLLGSSSCAQSLLPRKGTTGKKDCSYSNHCTLRPPGLHWRVCSD